MFKLSAFNSFVTKVAPSFRKHPQHIQLHPVAGYLHANLSDGAVLAKDVVHFLCRDLVRQVADVQDAVHLRREANLL